MLAATDLPRDAKGRIACLPTLQVVAPDGSIVEGAWSAGDCAAVPDLAAAEPGALCSPSAQHAVRQAVRLADNIRAVLWDRAPAPYRHGRRPVASPGCTRASQVYGIKLTGFVAWFMHRVP
jgi:NADH dehydrogenase